MGTRPQWRVGFGRLFTPAQCLNSDPHFKHKKMGQGRKPNTSPHVESSYIKRYSDGDLTAINELMNLYHTRLVGFCTNQISAKLIRGIPRSDIVSDAITDVHLKLSSKQYPISKDGETALPYVLKSCKHRIIDDLRNRMKEISFDREAQIVGTATDDSSHILDESDVQMIMTFVWRSRLSDLQKRVALLLIKNGGPLPNAEIAEKLGTTTGTVKDAKRRLKPVLTKIMRTAGWL